MSCLRKWSTTRLRMRKWFTTRFTFVIFVAFMNCMNMSFQRPCFRKWLTTRFTCCVIFVAFMNGVDVFLQICCSRKWLATRFTFVISLSFMYIIDVSLQAPSLRKWFVTWYAFYAFMNCFGVLHFLFIFESEFFFNTRWLSVWEIVNIGHCLNCKVNKLYYAFLFCVGWSLYYLIQIQGVLS